MVFIIGEIGTNHAGSTTVAKKIIDAAKNAGNSIRRKEQTHKMADANKAFAHFRY